MRIGHGSVAHPFFARFAAARMVGAPSTPDFDFIFKGLRAESKNLLDPTPATVAGLKLLGVEMEDKTPEDANGDGPMPAAYTYLGQFLDHDITLTAPSAPIMDIDDPSLAPIRDPASALSNVRTPVLDLDCLYGSPAQADPSDARLMRIGKVAPIGIRPPGKGEFNDLPRLGPNTNPSLDRAALIGDPRNDENLIVAQLHLAFLRAHNALVMRGAATKDAAAKELRQLTQRLVLTDFLPHIVDKTVLADVMSNGPKFFVPNSRSDLFMPLEFAVAAYRFGHSNVRSAYDYNVNFPNATLDDLFTFTALSGQIFGLPTVPQNWIIEWDRFVQLAPGGRLPSPARRFDTLLAEPLSRLRKVDETPEMPPKNRLAVRNLLRGYLLGVPTGQAVAQAMGLAPLSGAAMLAAVPGNQAVVLKSHNFESRTPLWFYCLAEAGNPNGPNGAHLGPVGSRIVAETYWNIIRFSPDTVLTGVGVQPPAFSLADLIALSGNGM